MDSYFTEANGNQVFLPTLHPRCRCCVRYEDAVKVPDRWIEGQNNPFTGVGADDTIEAESNIAAHPRKPASKAERAKIINEAIAKDRPFYADELSKAYDAYGIKPKEGYYDVLIHGAPDFVEYEHRYVLDAETLYLIISGRRDYNGEKIRLLSCSTGVRNEKGWCVAQELAQRLGVEVYAPKGMLFFNPDGKLTIGKTNMSEEEGFITFRPRNKRRRK